MPIEKLLDASVRINKILNEFDPIDQCILLATLTDYARVKADISVDDYNKIVEEVNETYPLTKESCDY